MLGFIISSVPRSRLEVQLCFFNRVALGCDINLRTQGDKLIAFTSEKCRRLVMPIELPEPNGSAFGT